MVVGGRMANGEWRMANGECRLSVVGCRLAVDGWHLINRKPEKAGRNFHSERKPLRSKKKQWRIVSLSIVMIRMAVVGGSVRNERHFERHLMSCTYRCSPISLNKPWTKMSPKHHRNNQMHLMAAQRLQSNIKPDFRRQQSKEIAKNFYFNRVNLDIFVDGEGGGVRGQNRLLAHCCKNVPVPVRVCVFVWLFYSLRKSGQIWSIAI